METVVRFHCAKKDKPFDVAFEWQDNRVWQIVEIKTVSTGFLQLFNSKRDVSTSEFEPSKANWERFECPWCGSSNKIGKIGYVDCPECERHMCGAFADGKNLRCTKKCGFVGHIVPAKEGGKAMRSVLRGSQSTAQLQIGNDKLLALPPKGKT